MEQSIYEITQIETHKYALCCCNSKYKQCIIEECERELKDKTDYEEMRNFARKIGDKYINKWNEENGRN